MNTSAVDEGAARQHDLPRLIFGVMRVSPWRRQEQRHGDPLLKGRDGDYRNPRRRPWERLERELDTRSAAAASSRSHFAVLQRQPAVPFSVHEVLLHQVSQAALLLLLHHQSTKSKELADGHAEMSKPA